MHIKFSDSESALELNPEVVTLIAGTLCTYILCFNFRYNNSVRYTYSVHTEGFQSDLLLTLEIKILLTKCFIQ